MKLRTRVPIVFGITFIILIVVMTAISSYIQLDYIERMELEKTGQNIERVVEALSEEIGRLSILTYDWGVWDDTYEFMNDANQHYIDSNLLDETFSNLKLNLMLFRKLTGEILYGTYFDLNTSLKIPLTPSINEYFDNENGPLRNPDVNKGTAGIIILSENPLLVASRYILKSNEIGPTNGVLVMGRYLDNNLLRKLTGLTRLSISISNFNEPVLSDFQKAKTHLVNNESVYVNPVDSFTIAGYTVLKDVYRNPILILRVDSSREILQQGRRDIYLNIFSMLVISIVFGLIITSFLNKVVLSRLTKLSDSVKRITLSGDLSEHIYLKGNDEISMLANSINGMLGVIEESREELSEKEELYRVIFENTGTATIIEDDDNTIILANSEFEKMSGYSKEEIEGKKAWTEFTKPEDLEWMLKYHKMRRIDPKAAPRNYEFHFLNREGKVLNVYNVVEMIPGTKRNIASIVDITEHKQAEEKLREILHQFKKMVEGAVYALVVSTELRDLYTSGHQERVSKLACAITREMNLKEEEVEAIRVIGLLHDVGKVNVPAEILTKPKKLTEVEFSIIKTHSQAGYDILKNIEFHWPVAEITLQHHERLDGSGYPRGLKDREMLLLAKIIAVADVVEAMLSHRPYRPAHGLEETMKEITQNKGILYEPEAVDACFRLFTEKGFSF